MKISFSGRTIPVALLLTCLLAFGLLIPWLGFYWDDWPTVWFLNRFGPSIFRATYGIDRPALGWLFNATTALVGQTPIAWQIFTLLTRWVACLSLWMMLRAAWPQRIMETAWVTFLFALYPGFKQQPIAFTYSADWIAIALFFFSFWLMIVSLKDFSFRRPRWRWLLMALSWLIAAYVMFADEYYFGLELLRPIFLWLALSAQMKNEPLEGVDPLSKQEKHARRKTLFWKTLLLWLPYLAIMTVFLYWRLIIFVSPRGQVTIIDQLASQPVKAAVALAGRIVGDLFRSSLFAWAQTLNPNNLRSLPLPWLAATILLALLGGLLAFTYFMKLRTNRIPADAYEAKEYKGWAIQAIWIGALALLVGGWPFWATNLPIELYFPWDRFNLAMMFGTSLALAGIIVRLARPPVQKALVFGILTGLALGFHFTNAFSYRQDWNLQKDFFWQLTYRAPQIQPGTLLLSGELPFKYYSDNSLTAPLNLIYAPDDRTLQLPYMFYNVESRLGSGLKGFEKNLPINQPYRIASFSGNTSNTLVLFYDPPRCLKVIDPATDLLLPRKPETIAQAAPLSNPNLIGAGSSTPARPPQAFFGTEPAPDWCTYFQKADLARQMGDWREVMRLADLAFALKAPITRANAAELVPYIEGYAHNAEWEQAINRTRQSFQSDDKMANMLCPIWYDISRSQPNDAATETAFDQASQILNCNFTP